MTQKNQETTLTKGENKDRAEFWLSEAGKELVVQLYMLIKTASVHEVTNFAYIKQSQNLFNFTTTLLKKEKELKLKSRSGHLFLNEVRVKFGFESYQPSKFIMELLQRYQMGEITITEGVTLQEVDCFIDLLIHLDSRKENIFTLLKQMLSEKQVTHLTIKEPEYEAESLSLDTSPESKKAAKKIFFKAISVVGEVMTNAQTDRPWNVVKAKRVIQSLVDQIIQNEAAFLELTAIKNFDDYTYVHSTNVCVLSIMFGVRLELSKNKLGELGFSALFHDIGKVKLPLDLINKKEKFDEYDWEQIRKHPILGVKILLSTLWMDEYTMRAVVVAFEHHMNLDQSGYPLIKQRRKLNLFSRIVSIADAYDAMTSGRVYIKHLITPDEAIRRMVATQGVAFDPVLVKIFINAMGIYPVGTVVLLDSDELGVVVRINPENLARPWVKIIADKNQRKEKLLLVDLAKFDKITNSFQRSVVRSVDPEKYNLDLSKYLL